MYDVYVKVICKFNNFNPQYLEYSYILKFFKQSHLLRDNEVGQYQKLRSF